MRISVACCTYNGARFLGDQLASIASQTRRPDEIVIVDDGSSDDSVALCASFAESVGDAIRVVVSRNPGNLGVVANFAKAMALTSGELIFLCDQDDVWHASKLEAMHAEFERRPDLLLLYSDARLIDARGVPLPFTLFQSLEVTARERRLVRGNAAFSALIARNLVTGATAALRRQVFDAALPFPPTWIHDEWLAVVASAIGTVDCLDLPLIDYRQHDANQIGIRRLTWRQKFSRLFRARGDHYVRMRTRTEELHAALVALGPLVPAARVAVVEDKLVHVEIRRSLSPNRLARLGPILLEVLSRRYGRYSSGWRSVLRDCLEPG